MASMYIYFILLVLMFDLVSPCWLWWIIGSVSLSVWVSRCFHYNSSTFKGQSQPQ